MPDLDELKRLMQAGDAAALDEIARAYGPRLLAVARRHCRCASDAEDAVQDALVTAQRAMRSFRGEASPLSWLSTLVARRCWRLNEDAARTVSDDVEHAADGGLDDAVERRALGDAIGRALMTLSRTDRLAFLLAAEGSTSDEIAAHFGLSSDAVRSRLKRARKILRALVTQELPASALPDHDATQAHRRRLPSGAERSRATALARIQRGVVPAVPRD